MLNFEGKYGNIHVSGRSIDIEDLSLEEMKQYLQELEGKQMKLTNEQNDYISQIIMEKETKDGLSKND